MFDLIRDRKWKRQQAMIDQAMILGASNAERAVVDAVRGEWAARYNELSDTLDQVTNLLEEATEVSDAARSLLTVMALRTHGGKPLFLINTDCAPGEAETLRHAICALQATLEGSDLPDFVSVDRVTH